MNSRTLEWQQRSTAHYNPVRDVCFPRQTSELFVTCSDRDIRVWLTSKKQELLRIQVPNLVCNCVAIAPDGSMIISGWEDGKIRAFAPESGKLLWSATNAHQKGVTSLACPNESTDFFISGGADGRVRLWQLRTGYGAAGSEPAMRVSVKEHSKDVSSLDFSFDDQTVGSASKDGSVIMWNLSADIDEATGAVVYGLSRSMSVQNTTMFSEVQFHPDASQFLTCGSDRKITYWSGDDG